MNLSADLSALGMTGRLYKIYKLDKLDKLYFSTPLEDQNTYLRQAGFTNLINLINFTNLMNLINFTNFTNLINLINFTSRLRSKTRTPTCGRQALQT